jgi:outer membrane protein assembly factor BamB
MRLPNTIAIVVVVALLGADVVRADDWPQFRGPTGQGHANGQFPTEWGPDKNITWKQNVPGSGWSSPVVWAGRVYLTSAVRVNDSATKDLSLRALCLDGKTGNILWDVEALRQPGNKVPGIHGKNSNASPTPIVDGKHLFVHFGHLGTACLDLDGKVVWRNTELRYSPVHGNGGSPILVDELLVFSIDGADKQQVVALEQATGNVKWKTDRQSKSLKKFSFGTPLLIEVQGQRQIISSASDLVAAYDPTTGKEIWRLRYEGYSIIARPVYGQGLLFLSTCYDTPSLLAIRPDGNGDVTGTHLAWSKKKVAPHAPSPILDGNQLYLVSDGGLASCLDAKTGDVHWSQRLQGGFSASPLLADGKVYFQNEEGMGFVVKASTKFELLAQNDMKEKTLASYAAVDGAIFLRTAERLYRIEKR